MAEYIQARGILYRTEIMLLKRAAISYNLFMSFFKAWEAIYERFHQENMKYRKIRIEFIIRLDCLTQFGH